MKTCLNKTKLLLGLLAPLILSCVGERCSSCNQSISDKQLFKVSFRGNYAETKSISAFQAGVETSIFTYYSGEDPSLKREHPSTPVKAISDISGKLRLANNQELYLAPGYYDFYATSANSSSLNGLSFKMGQSDSLKNGIDYLWSQKRDITICNHSNIEFNFKHIATLIIIEMNPMVDSQTDLEQVELTKATIGIPANNQTLMLSTGEITPAKEISNLRAQMHLNNNKVAYIILPLQKKVEIPVELIVTTISGPNTHSIETYHCTLPSPPNGFMGGIQYKYRATISLQKIVFGNTVVEQWNEKELANIYLSESK